MNTILVTQRVDLIENRNERRDSLDRRMVQFLLACGYLPIMLPNSLEYVQELIRGIDYCGVLLTGGNDLMRYGGDVPERDSVEVFLLEIAISKKHPIFGVCRGMQLIQDYFGVELEKIDGHVGCRHSLKVEQDSSFSQVLSEMETVNSFHNYGTKMTVPQLTIIATSPDGIVEGIKHNDLPIFGQMWHPEREIENQMLEIAVFRSIFSTI